MKTHRDKLPRLPQLLAIIAVALSGTAGLATLVGQGPASSHRPGATHTLDQRPAASAGSISITTQPGLGPVSGEARARGMCAECGMVVSAREIDAADEGGRRDAPPGANLGNTEGPGLKRARRYEITVRLADGSSRVIGDASSASWRPGQRLVIIDGTSASGR